MNKNVVFDIARTELSVFREFLNVLKAERDAIISFSLEGIVRENNRKEELLKKIEYLENEKERIFKDIPDHDEIFKSKSWTCLSDETKNTMKEINAALNKNKKLLSFSIDHVRSSIENVVNFVNRASYGKASRERISLFSSKVI